MPDYQQLEEHLAPAAGLIELKEVHTRFLWPFAFDVGRHTEAAQALCEQRLGLEGRVLWTSPGAPHLYRDEYLEHVSKFLYAATGSSACCRHLEIDAPTADRWFQDAQLETQEGWQTIAVVNAARIELFLSPHGAGVLSINLRSAGKAPTIQSVLDFNYLLAQARGQHPARIRKKHPRDDLEVWKRLSSVQQLSAGLPPAVESPLTVQLESRGGTFRLKALAEWLLQPLLFWNLRPTQPEFGVYTAVRLSVKDDFSTRATREALSPFLSGLAQVEESTHSGAPPGELTADGLVLNRLHWCAASQLGAAHLLADQDQEFDNQKLGIVRDKYFTAYLAALLQRIVLDRVLRDAGESAGAEATPARAKALSALRAELLDFAVRGNFVQVSVRHAVQRFYSLARETLGVPQGWSDLHSALDDFESRVQIEAQTRLAETQTQIIERSERHLDAIEKVQRFVHVLEYVLVSVYLAHLWHMLELFHGRPQQIGTGVAALVGLVVVRFLDRHSRA